MSARIAFSPTKLPSGDLLSLIFDTRSLPRRGYQHAEARFLTVIVIITIGLHYYRVERVGSLRINLMNFCWRNIGADNNGIMAPFIEF